MPDSVMTVAERTRKYGPKEYNNVTSVCWESIGYSNNADLFFPLQTEVTTPAATNGINFLELSVELKEKVYEHLLRDVG